MASRVIPNVDRKAHRLTIASEHGGELVFVRGGQRAYLWVGKDGQYVTSMSGVATLRRLAEAILDEVGPATPNGQRVEEGNG